MIKNYNQYIKENWNDSDEFYEFEDEEDDHFDDFITDNLFRQFLIDNDCLENYVRNRTEYKKRANKFESNMIIQFFKDRNRNAYLPGAFNFNLTDEGLEFWFDMQDRWRDYRRDHINEKYEEFYEFEDEEDDHFDDSFITNDKFRQFLIDNNCLENYVRNVEEDIKKRNNTHINFDKWSEKEYITGAFSWFYTPEKNLFWADLDDKWHELNGWDDEDDDYDDYDDENDDEDEDIEIDDIDENEEDDDDYDWRGTNQK